MSIHNAILLLSAIENDAKLRASMYDCRNKEELMDYLESQGYIFSSDQFEEAVNHLHVQCQSLEQAQMLLQKAEWLRLLFVINQITTL